ncbi:hypothetical protein PZE06_07885 [Robertmurraya sp. DFI.2.37]|uniref:hypothetical protein n=1 Tax=Robertmurraya sp. DFI.2.37 TaxID=3031819 RepID=UPI0012492CEB|nr:hypothetical protein [Robertmurraya sp. DFI.2.37]MDF1508103.1 hypothetical protein [Robertmurraya sp. DFI.2.37]
MKSYRITWFAVVEEGSVLEGRSLVTADSQEKAIADLVAKKSAEYRLKPYMINIQSIIEM